MVAGMGTISDFRFPIEDTMESEWLANWRTDARVLLLGFFFGLRLARFAAAHGAAAGAAGREDAVGSHPLDERLDLALAAGNVNHHLFGTHIDDTGAEYLNQLANFGSLAPRRRIDLEQHQIALDVVTRADVIDLDDRDDLFELLAD